MTHEDDFMLRSVDLFRNLTGVMLSSSQELGAASLDTAQAFIARNSEQLRKVLSDVRALHSAGQHQAAVEAGIRNTLQAARNIVLTASECQKESLSLMQQRVAEAHLLLCDAFDEPMGAMPAAGSQDRSAHTASTLSHKHAA